MPDDMARSNAERLPTRAATQERMCGVEVAVRSEARLRKVRVFQLRPHPLQPSERHAAHNVHDLMESIQEIGLQEPPLIRRLPNGTYEILAGHRRSAAWQMLTLSGLIDEKIPAFVHVNLSDREALYIVAAEYAHNEDYSPLHIARIVGATVQERRAEIGREPGARDLAAILPWEKSSIAAYRKVYDALQDARLAPLVQRLDSPDISLLYKALCVSEFSRTVEVLEAYVDSGANAARKILNASKGGRPKQWVSRKAQGNGYDLTVRFRPSMPVEDARAALARLESLRDDLLAKCRVDEQAGARREGANAATAIPSVRRS